ncbi:MAG: DNA translocase FtsK, partial [Dehalococcoidia bacterium]|nr:DNA translocase FtsK [Dehalococcoidia bacterium]
MAKARARRRPRSRKRSAIRTRAILKIVLTRQFAGYILVLLALILLFSMLTSAGPFSTWWQTIFGWFSPLAVLALLAGGFLVAFSSRGQSRFRSFWQPLVGFALGSLALLAILSVLSPITGSGGGLLGTAIGYPLRGLGSAGAFLVLVVCGAVAVLWGCRVPPQAIGRRIAVLGRGAKALSNKRPRITRQERPAVVANLRSTPVREPEILGSMETIVEEDMPSPIVKEGTAAADAKALPTAAPSLMRTESGGLEWQLPPIDLMDSTAALAPNEREIRRKAQIIEETLAHFGVPVKVTEISQGPAVTQFGVEPGFDVKTKEIKDKEKRVIRVDEVSRIKVKVARITSLTNDLALALSAQSLRIQAPVPGRSVVGIEVPNTSISLVGLRGVIESIPFQRLLAKSKLALALGRGVDGEAIVGDLGKMPHLLIAGATGSGKSVCLNSLIACLLMDTTPDEVRLLLVDPKRVELSNFRGIPHLWTPVVMETEDVVRVLKMVTHEMDERYKRFAHAGA